jgi:hypothetical protein
MGHLNVEPIPLDHPNITNTSYHTGVIERYKSIGMSGEMGPAQLSEKKPLRCLNRPHVLAIYDGRNRAVRDLTQRIGDRNSGRNGAETSNSFNDSSNNIDGNTTASRVMNEHTLTRLITPFSAHPLRERLNA